MFLILRSRDQAPKRSHQLRYVLRNKTTSEIYLVILFTIHRAENVNEDGTLKEEDAKPHTPPPSSKNGDSDSNHDEETALEEARKHLGPTHEEKSRIETSIDDLD